MSKTKAILFKNWPEGLPDLEKDFETTEVDIPALEDGFVLVQTLWLSVDPYMRGRMRDVKSYFPSFEIGKPLTGGGVGRVLESKADGYKEGDIVTGFFPWQEKAVLNASEKFSPLLRLENFPLSLSTALGVLGMPGMTAYFGFLEICKPKDGETVVVSGAAGAVGSLVGQIAKIKGCHVIGIAGTDEKCNVLKELGFDETINYKTTENMAEAIGKAAPKGVDCYFDNVGGEIKDAVFTHMNQFGRVSCCGAISTYNATSMPTGPRDEWAIITKSLLKQGFIVTNWQSRFPEGGAQMGKWVAEGKIKFKETVREGLENTPKAFIEMMTGSNIGKMVVKVSE